MRIERSWLLLFTPALLGAQQPCEKLAGLKLARTTITAALVPEGPLQVPNPFGPSQTINVPARCMVKGVARPTNDSEIKFELWLPPSGWNGKYERTRTERYGPGQSEGRFSRRNTPQRQPRIDHGWRCAAGAQGRWEGIQAGLGGAGADGES